jgi:hypothetical protein
VIKPPVYDPQKDGNVFRWLLIATQVYRHRKQTEADAAKEAATKLKRLDEPKVENS